MPSKTNKQALESAIKKKLSCTRLEELNEQGIQLKTPNERVESYRAGNGYYIGSPNDFNLKNAVDEYRFWDFLQTTQKEELAKLQNECDWKLKILERLDRMVKKYGVITMFRKGFRCR